MTVITVAVLTSKLCTEEQYNARQSQSQPMLDAFYAWLDTPTISGKIVFAKAM